MSLTLSCPKKYRNFSWCPISIVADSTNVYTKTETRWCLGDGLSQ